MAFLFLPPVDNVDVDDPGEVETNVGNIYVDSFACWLLYFVFMLLLVFLIIHLTTFKG
jgi:hypothetical protein